MSATVATLVLASIMLVVLITTLIRKIMNGVGRYIDLLSALPQEVHVSHGWPDGLITTASPGSGAELRNWSFFLRLLIWGSPPAFEAPPLAQTILTSARLWALLGLVVFCASIIGFAVIIAIPLLPLWIVLAVWVLGGAYVPGRWDAKP